MGNPNSTIAEIQKKEAPGSNNMGKKNQKCQAVDLYMY